MHSKAKLALGVLTSPRVAFEEIMERKLLGSAFVIVALTGITAMISGATRVHTSGPIQWFTLGKENPITWFGLYLLYALAVHGLMKWLGTENRYADVLLALGWAQVSLLLGYGIRAIGGLLIVGGAPQMLISRYVEPAYTVLELAYLPLAGMALSVMCGTTFLRGLLSYLVIELAAVIAFAQTYVASRLSLFGRALPGVGSLASTVIGTDYVPWAGAAVVGFVAGIWFLARELEWDTARRNRLMVTCGLVSAVLFGAYTYSVYKIDYFGKLLTVDGLYNRDKYKAAATKLQTLLPISRTDAPKLMVDLGNLYYLAGDDAESLRYYKKSLEAMKPLHLPEEQFYRAQAYNGIGTAYDAQGNLPAAVDSFTKAAKDWPEFRDPWVRLAITYDRMGDYKEAMKAGEHAGKKLGSRANVLWVAMLQAFTQAGEAKNAKVAYDALEKADKGLAKRIGEQPDDWKNAVAKLTRSDLKFPLESQFAAPPPRPDQKQPPKKAE